MFEYQSLMQIADQKSAEYQENKPFPHVVLDDFISPELVESINCNFPDMTSLAMGADEAKMLDGQHLAQSGKKWLSMELKVSLKIRKLYWLLNSGYFLSFLERLTGIEGLIADPHLVGGGLHETQQDGFLFVHADYNKHPEFNLDRRLNLLLYLNPEWDESYGGALELWDKELTRCEKKVFPIAGRCVIFSTTRDSFHGHPEPLTCPDGVTRRSLALYYYTNGRPKNENDTPHLTLWKKV